jgi:FkbM family methyltransferase
MRLRRARRLFEVAAALSRLSPGLRGSAWVWLLTLLAPAKHRLPLLRNATFAVSLVLADQRRPYFFADHSQLIALKEVVIDGEYALEPKVPVHTILDIGANTGQATLYFRARFPDARIVAVEPARESFSLLERNVGGDPRTELRRCAVTRDDGPVTLRTYNLSWMNQVTTASSPARRPRTEQVLGLSLVTLMDEAGLETVDLAKVDIEGLEYDVLLDSPALRRIGTLVCELHSGDYPVDAKTFVDLLQAGGGFTSSRFIGRYVVVLERGGAARLDPS